MSELRGQFGCEKEKLLLLLRKLNFGRDKDGMMPR